MFTGLTPCSPLGAAVSFPPQDPRKNPKQGVIRLSCPIAITASQVRRLLSVSKHPSPRCCPVLPRVPHSQGLECRETVCLQACSCLACCCYADESLQCGTPGRQQGPPKCCSVICPSLMGSHITGYGWEYNTELIPWLISMKRKGSF